MEQHVEIIKHIKFAFHFNETLLLRDLEKVKSELWCDHFNKGGYDGGWTSIALFAPEGDPCNIIPQGGNSPLKLFQTPILTQCQYFQEVLGHFKTQFLSVRLLRLNSGALIKPHEDYKLGYEDDCFRIHVPITTNSKVRFTLDNVQLNMKPGECWYTNVNYTHSVSNLGESERVHLVFDCKRNNWSDKLFFSIASPEAFRARDVEPYDDDTVQRIIEELELRKPEGFENLIVQLISKRT